MLKLLQGYYHFLALGKFMEQVIITNDLSELAMNLPLKTGNSSSFLLKEHLIKQLLLSIHKAPNKRNVYGYLTEISAFKGIFSVMKETIDGDLSLRTFLKTVLKDQYAPFEQIIRFLRNVLNHSVSSGLLLKLEDYEVQKEFLMTSKNWKKNHPEAPTQVNLDFVYANYITQRKGSKHYGVHISLDFAELRPGISLESLIDWHNLYLLAELCFNLAQLADAYSRVHKPKKSLKELKPKQTSSSIKNNSSKKKKSGLC